MKARSLVLVIAVYVGLDVTNPFMPGAFTFDPEASVEGLHPEPRPLLVAMVAPASPRVEPEVAPIAGRRPMPAGRRWLGEPRKAHDPASDPPPISEDH